MHTFSRFLLLVLTLGAFGCGSVKQMVPDPDAKTWQDVVSAVVDAPALPPVAVPAAFPPPVFLPMPPDAPSAADRAAQAKGGNTEQDVLRAAWKELKARHVPARVLTIALQQLSQGGFADNLAMPPDPGLLDLSTGGLGALLLAIVAGLLKRKFAASST